jgi:hypothetical protein
MVEGAQMEHYIEFQEVTVILNGHNLEIEDAGRNVLKYQTVAGPLSCYIMEGKNKYKDIYK